MLAQLQSLLHRIYDVDAGHDVNDFLISDPALAACLAACSPGNTPERLLLAQCDDGLELSLFVDDKVLQRLQSENPLQQLHDGNLQDFWTALEGVSHFTYVAWNARFDKCVTMLELELQAEVDKYVATLMLLHEQMSGKAPRRLHHWLFARPGIDASLDEPARRRYRHANRFAARYCRMLERGYLGRVRGPGLIGELRRFYRMPQTDKLDRIQMVTV